jgi:hypothetical protein
MRLWSLHPKYLDAKGLVAVWREGLLARAVLLGNTRGYRNHPQLQRFRAVAEPVVALDGFLGAVCDEAEKRGYHFDRSKIESVEIQRAIPVTNGQVAYEGQHLLNKLRLRDPQRVPLLEETEFPELNPVFTLVDGPIEGWEKV